MVDTRLIHPTTPLDVKTTSSHVSETPLGYPSLADLKKRKKLYTFLLYMTINFRVACYLVRVIESVPHSKAVDTPRIDPMTAALISKECVYMQS